MLGWPGEPKPSTTATRPARSPSTHSSTRWPPPTRAAAKVDDYVDEYLNEKDASAPPLEHPITSQVDGELRELRVRFAKTQYRVLYRRSGLLVVLLHIFEKDTDKLPSRERGLAVKRFDDFKARMDAEPRRRPRAAGHDAPPKTRGE